MPHLNEFRNRVSYIPNMKHTTKQYAQALYASLKDADGKEFSVRVKAFLSMLKRNRMLRLLPKILREVENLEKGQHAVVESVRALPQHTITALQETLGVTRVEQKTMPELLGGMVVEWNDWRVDGSVRGRLQQLERRI